MTPSAQDAGHKVPEGRHDSGALPVRTWEASSARVTSRMWMASAVMTVLRRSKSASRSRRRVISLVVLATSPAAIHDAFVAVAWFGLAALAIAVFLMPRSTASMTPGERRKSSEAVRAASG